MFSYKNKLLVSELLIVSYFVGPYYGHCFFSKKLFISSFKEQLTVFVSLSDKSIVVFASHVVYGTGVIFWFLLGHQMFTNFPIFNALNLIFNKTVSKLKA